MDIARSKPSGKPENLDEVAEKMKVLRSATAAS
jgi:hypothetical protein